MADTTEDVTLFVAEKQFRFWNDLEIHRAVDTFSAVSFAAPFEPDRPEFRQIFRPFSFQPIVCQVAGATLLTGTMVGVDPFVSATEKRIQVSGYALPAVLEDCTPPATLRPLEWKKLRLQAIADALCEPFGLSARILGDEGGPFEKVAIDIDEKVAPFLVELAKQRGFVINDNEAGQLRIWRSIETGRPVARLVAGEPPVTEIRPTFSPQDYYSEITGFCPKKRGKKGTNHTEPNRWLTSPLRPMVFKLDDTERAETEEATKAKLGRMFANMLSLSVDVATWRDPQGAIWAPNTTITLLAPDAMIYRETEMLVRSVVLRQSKDATSATLELVLPGAFSGKVPEALPWDE